MDLNTEKRELDRIVQAFVDEEACFKRLFKTTIGMIMLRDENNRLHIDNYRSRIEEIRKSNRRTHCYQDSRALTPKPPLRLMNGNIDNLLSRNTHFTSNNVIVHGKNENIVQNHSNASSGRGVVSWDNTNFKNKLTASLYYKLLLKVHFESLKYYATLYHTRLTAIQVYRLNREKRLKRIVFLRLLCDCSTSKYIERYSSALANRYVLHKYVVTYVHWWKRFHLLCQMHRGMLSRISKRRENQLRRRSLAVLARRVRFRIQYRKLVYWANGTAKTWNIVRSFCAWMVAFCTKNVLKMTLFQRVSKGDGSNHSILFKPDDVKQSYNHVGAIIKDIQLKMSLNSIGMSRVRMLLKSKCIFEHVTQETTNGAKYPTLVQLIALMNNSKRFGAPVLNACITGLLPPSCRKYLLNALEGFCLLKSFNHSRYMGGDTRYPNLNGSFSFNGSFISTNYLTGDGDDNADRGTDMWLHSRNRSVIWDQDQANGSTFWDIDTSSEEEMESAHQRIAHRKSQEKSRAAVHMLHRMEDSHIDPDDSSEWYDPATDSYMHDVSYNDSVSACIHELRERAKQTSSAVHLSSVSQLNMSSPGSRVGDKFDRLTQISPVKGSVSSDNEVRVLEAQRNIDNVSLHNSITSNMRNNMMSLHGQPLAKLMSVANIYKHSHAYQHYCASKPKYIPQLGASHNSVDSSGLLNLSDSSVNHLKHESIVDDAFTLAAITNTNTMLNSSIATNNNMLAVAPSLSQYQLAKKLISMCGHALKRLLRNVRIRKAGRIVYKHVYYNKLLRFSWKNWEESFRDRMLGYGVCCELRNKKLVRNVFSRWKQRSVGRFVMLTAQVHLLTHVSEIASKSLSKTAIIDKLNAPAVSATLPYIMAISARERRKELYLEKPFKAWKGRFEYYERHGRLTRFIQRNNCGKQLRIEGRKWFCTWKARYAETQKFKCAELLVKKNQLLYLFKFWKKKQSNRLLMKRVFNIYYDAICAKYFPTAWSYADEFHMLLSIVQEWRQVVTTRVTHRRKENVDLRSILFREASLKANMFICWKDVARWRRKVRYFYIHRLRLIVKKQQLYQLFRQLNRKATEVEQKSLGHYERYSVGCYFKMWKKHSYYNCVTRPLEAVRRIQLFQRFQIWRTLGRELTLRNICDMKTKSRLLQKYFVEVWCQKYHRTVCYKIGFRLLRGIFYRIKARWVLITWPGREAYIKAEALRYEKLKRLRGKNSLKQLVTDPSMIHASFSLNGSSRHTGGVSDRMRERSMNLVDSPRLAVAVTEPAFTENVSVALPDPAKSTHGLTDKGISRPLVKRVRPQALPKSSTKFQQPICFKGETEIEYEIPVDEPRMPPARMRVPSNGKKINEAIADDKRHKVSWRDDNNMSLVHIQNDSGMQQPNKNAFLSAADLADDLEEDEWDDLAAHTPDPPALQPPPPPLNSLVQKHKKNNSNVMFFVETDEENDPPLRIAKQKDEPTWSKDERPSLRSRRPANKSPSLSIDTAVDSDPGLEVPESESRTASKLCDTIEAMVEFDMGSDEYDSDDGVVDAKAIRKQRLLEFVQNKRKMASSRTPVLSARSPTLLHPNSPRYRPKQTSNDYKAANFMNPFESFLKSKNGDGTRCMRDRAAELGYLGEDIDGYMDHSAYKKLLEYLKLVMNQWLQAAVYERRLRLNARDLSVRHDRIVQMDFLLRWMSVTSRTSHRSLIWTTLRKRRHSMVKSIEAAKGYAPPKGYHLLHAKLSIENDNNIA